MNGSPETKIVATRTVSTVADLLAFIEDCHVDHDTTELAFPVVHLVEETADGARQLTLDIDYDDEVEEEAVPVDEASTQALPAATD